MPRRTAVAVWIGASLLTLSPLISTAPSASAAPAPATKPSADETAIRSVLKLLARSLQDGDAEGIRRVIYAANPTERRMVDAMAAMAVEISRLGKAAGKAYGEDAAKELTGDLSAELARIDAAEVVIDAAGDSATVRYKADAAPTTAPTTSPADADAATQPAPAPMILRKVDGQWHVPMAELSKDTTPEEIDERLADLDAQTKVVAELTAEVAKGQHKSAQKAAEAWQAKTMQALTPSRKPDDAKKPDEPAKPK